MEGGAGRNGKEREEEQDGMSWGYRNSALCDYVVMLFVGSFEGSASFAIIYCFDRQFSSDEVLQLLDRFYNIEMLFQKPDDEEAEILNHEEDFSLPQSYFVKEE
ncbi:hypothetical protein POTOM_036372 [Populus tomentosa]|uniref:Uncharacterized protein n=1 Tax=Populus tomentosa TaxID=118781 RepID=A0A8X7YUQ8_POPTO|nr:hypothetical protein POTOM_036372 [Populus tomentosa]